MSITVYTKQDCVPCARTVSALNRRGLEFEVVSLDDRPELVDEFRSQGLLAAPVVIAGEQRWSGLRPDLIVSLEAPQAA